MATHSIDISLPEWLIIELSKENISILEQDAQMLYVINLARKNVENKTGGPFAACVFDMDSGSLISAGVNLVTTHRLSISHAEVIAIMLAQNALKNYNLSDNNLPNCVLVTSTEPCIMCLGAFHWSGIKHLVCGARDEDAREAGFDEGDKPDDWLKKLKQRGISVTVDVKRDESIAVLKQYVVENGVIY